MGDFQYNLIATLATTQGYSEECLILANAMSLSTRHCGYDTLPSFAVGECVVPLILSNILLFENNRDLPSAFLRVLCVLLRVPRRDLRVPNGLCTETFSQS